MRGSCLAGVASVALLSGLSALVALSACAKPGEPPPGGPAGGSSAGDAERTVEAVATADVPRARGALVVDGRLDEADWQRAPLMTFRPHLGRGAPKQATTARLLWTAEHLWLGIVAADDDVFSPYTARDQPLYESEAYEIFIDADGDGARRDGVYVELQSNAFDVHFDAAFAGGSRKNMQLGYDVPFVTKTVVDAAAGVVTQEWLIPVAALRDVPAGEPRVGADWQVNLFRLERRRRGDEVIGAEASAWSPPLANDFHRLDRFGVVRFVD